jgi:hypothetical protein
LNFTRLAPRRIWLMAQSIPLHRRNGRCRMHCGLNLFAMSISGFDPEQTSFQKSMVSDKPRNVVTVQIG